MPADWWQLIRDELPAYDPLTTPNRLLGLRADLRYYQAFVDENAGEGGYFEDYGFWDVSVGVTLQLPLQRWPDAW